VHIWKVKYVLNNKYIWSCIWRWVQMISTVLWRVGWYTPLRRRALVRMIGFISS
jgi:hypothetical protein